MKSIEKTCIELAKCHKNDGSTETDCIEIPAVQRGLVWNAQQVGTLWDSILQNMPIGTFLAYRDSESGPLQLIDGQQRFNAIKCGIRSDVEDAFRIWVGLLEGKLLFMACSESHPWGYNERYETFSSPMRGKYNSWLKGEQYEEDNDITYSDTDIIDDEFFKTADINQSYPALALKKDIIFVPLPLVIEAVENNAYDAYYDKWDKSASNICGYINPSEIALLLKDSDRKGVPSKSNIKEEFKTICSKMNGKNVLGYRVTINEIESDEKLDDKYISTLFSRINTQGTKLTSDDERYCTLCVMLGKDIKTEIGKLSEGKWNYCANKQSYGFMPPSRLANWIVRLYKINNDEKRNVCTPATDSEFREVVNDNNKNRFISFCKSECKQGGVALGEIIECIKRIYNQNDDNAVPPLVYLEHHDDNWITVLALLIQKYPEFFKSNADCQLFPLLGMLPDVFCSRSDCSHYFIMAFWDAVKECPAEFHKDLKTLISYGCAVAALHENTFVAFASSGISLLNEIANKDILDNGWEWNLEGYQSRPAIPFTHSKYILYYAQRKYLNRILVNIKPEKRELWGVDSNKPFDIDHIIPWSLWGEEYMADRLPNKQVLFYRHNREKNNHYIGLPNTLKSKSEEWFAYAHDIYQNCEVENSQDDNHDNYKTATYARWTYIIETVYNDLHVLSVIQTINDFASLLNLQNINVKLANAIHRYNFMRARLKEHEMQLSWGSVIYRGLSRNNVLGMAKIGNTIDFSQSLVPWLSLGVEKQIEGLPALYCITMGVDKDEVEVGKRRGFGISLYSEALRKWADLATANACTHPQWWNDVKTCSTNGYESQLKDYFKSLLSSDD